MVFFVCLFVHRHREKKRQQQRLAAEAAHQPRAHQYRQQQQPAHRPPDRNSPDWFGEANQNQGHGRGRGHTQGKYGPVNHGWAAGFDAAATTAQTNFGETPQTFRPFADGTAAVDAARHQPNYLDSFAPMNNRY